MYEHIKPVVVLHGRPRLEVGRGHGMVFIPQAMVEQDKLINDSDNTERNTFGIKDIHKEATVDIKGQAASKRKKEFAALAKDLGPEIAKETDLEEQIKALEEFRKAKQREDNTASNKDLYAGRLSVDSQYPAIQHDSQSNSQLGRQSSYSQDVNQGSHQQSVVVPAQGDWAAQQHLGVANEGKRQAVFKTEDEKAALAQHLGPEIARETNIEEQVKALEKFMKAKQCAAVQPVRSTADSQYPAVQHYYPHSNSQLGRQSSYTQDPHQDSHQPSVVVPAQGDWAAQQHVGIGSAAVISNSNPPRTIPQVNGNIAGMELVSYNA